MDHGDGLMGTKTVQNGPPHGSRDVQWGREVVTTVTAIAAVLLTILCLVVGAVVYNAKEFAVAADDRAAVKIHVEKVEGKIDVLSAKLEVLVEKANEAHARTDRRLDDIERWRYGQTISGWSPRRGKR
jgi:hypothetical protein